MRKAKPFHASPRSETDLFKRYYKDLKMLRPDDDRRMLRGLAIRLSRAKNHHEIDEMLEEELGIELETVRSRRSKDVQRDTLPTQG